MTKREIIEILISHTGVTGFSRLCPPDRKVTNDYSVFHDYVKGIRECKLTSNEKDQVTCYKCWVDFVDNRSRNYKHKIL